MSSGSTWTPSLAERDVPVVRVGWRPCLRIVPSRFPPIQLFERVADPADLEAVLELESLTDSRLRDEAGDIRLRSAINRFEVRVSDTGEAWIERLRW